MNRNLAELLQAYRQIGTIKYKCLFKALVLDEIVDDINELSLEELEGINNKLEECYNYYMNRDSYTTIIHPKIIETYLM